MDKLTIERAGKEFSLALWRNRWMSLGTIISMAMVFFLAWLVFAVNDSSQRIIDRVEKKVDVGVFFQKEAGDFQIESFVNELERQKEEGSIRDFQYFSKEYAMEEMKKKFPEKVRFLERYQFENPLQASVEIIPGEWSPDQIFKFLQEERFETIVDFTFLDKYQEKKDEVNRILRLLVFFRQGGVFLMVVFLLISAFLIGFFVSSILNQKKREVFIMRLVGATHSFIRLPFLLEGVTLALLAFLLSFGMFHFFLTSMAPRIVNFFPNPSDHTFIGELIFETQRSFQSAFWVDIFVLIIGSGLISFLTVERFLKKRHLLGDE